MAMKKRSFMSAVALAASLTASWAHAQTPIQLSFSTYLPPSYEYISKPIDNFIKRVETESKGRVKFKVFHSGQLYDGYQELPAVTRGDIDMANVSGTYASGAVPALNFFTLPFNFASVEHMRRALDAGLMDQGIRTEMADKHNAVVLGTTAFDPYEFWSRRTPIVKASDIRGKVWATTGSADARAIQLLGGSPTAMSSGDLYLALDRGVIDGTPRPMITGTGRSLFDVAKHLSLATFAVDTSILVINKKKFDSLPADIQDIITKAGKERDKEQFERVGAYMAEAVKQFEAKGVKVNRVSPEEIEKMRQQTLPAVTEWKAKVPNSAAYFDLVQKTKTP
jgi:TRAP-type C4-dicarboxylate transport system substrate-binding protein